MALTPNEIIDKDFGVKLRGFDREEVKTFLEEVANALAEVIKERNELKDKVILYKKQVAHLKQQEAEFRKALAAAHQASEDMKENARKEAEIIIDRAKLDAEQIVADAHKEAVALEDKIRRLKMLHKETIIKIRSSIESFSRLLNEEIDYESDNKLKNELEEMEPSLKEEHLSVKDLPEEKLQQEAKDSATKMEEELEALEKEIDSLGEEEQDKDKNLFASLPFMNEFNNDNQENKGEGEPASKEQMEEEKEKKADDFGFQPGKIWPES